MKYLTLLILLLLSYPLLSNVDVGRCYYFEIEYAVQDGKVLSGFAMLSSYFLSIDEVDSSHIFYCSDYLFENINNPNSLNVTSRHDFGELAISDSNKQFDACALAALTIYTDSLMVYDEIGRLHYRDRNLNLQQIPFFEGANGNTLAKSTITHFHIIRVINCVSGQGLAANMQYEDIQWATIENFAEFKDLGVPGACSYTALSYSPSSQESISAMAKLEESATLSDQINNAPYTKDRRQQYMKARKEVAMQIERLKKLHILVLVSCSC